MTRGARPARRLTGDVVERGGAIAETAAPVVPLERYGWPPILTLRLAQAYTDRSAWILRRAVASGQLRAAGRCGRVPTFRRDDLDVHLLGGHAADQVRGGDIRATDRDVKPTKLRGPPPAALDDLALARLRQLAKGGAR